MFTLIITHSISLFMGLLLGLIIAKMAVDSIKEDTRKFIDNLLKKQIAETRKCFEDKRS